jgi:hypothetical protein
VADPLPDGIDSLHNLRTRFIFVPHGDPEPLEWMAAHPGWVKFPAVMVPRVTPRDEPELLPPAADDPDRRQAGMRWATARRPIPPDPHQADPYDPMSPAFDPVRTLQKLGHLP